MTKLIKRGTTYQESSSVTAEEELETEEAPNNDNDIYYDDQMVGILDFVLQSDSMWLLSSLYSDCDVDYIVLGVLLGRLITVH